MSESPAVTPATNETARPLQPGDEVEYDGRRCTVERGQFLEYPDAPNPRVFLRHEELTTTYWTPLVSKVRRVEPAASTPDETGASAVSRAAVSAAADAMTALLAPFAHQCNLFVTGQVGLISPTTTEVATAALTDAAPYLTADLRDEVARLRTENDKYAELWHEVVDTPRDGGEAEIWLRRWMTSGSTITDDPEEYADTWFVRADEVHEIIRAYLVANGLPVGGTTPDVDPAAALRGEA